MGENRNLTLHSRTQALPFHWALPPFERTNVVSCSFLIQSHCPALSDLSCLPCSAVRGSLQEMSSMCVLAFLFTLLNRQICISIVGWEEMTCAPSGIVYVERGWHWDGNGPVESWVVLGVCPTGVEWVLWFGSPRGTQAVINFLFHWKPVIRNVLFFHDTLDVWRGCISQISCLKWTLGSLGWQWPSWVVTWSRWKGVEGHRCVSRIAVECI